MPTPDPDTRIAELEATVARLEARLVELIDHDAVPRPAGSAPDTTAATPVGGTGSRRDLLRLAAGAAAGGAAVAVTTVGGRAAADDDDPIRAGQTTSQGNLRQDPTVVQYVNSSVPEVGPPTANGNVFLVRDDPAGMTIFDPSSSSYPASAAGYAYDVITNGVYGFSQVDEGAGVVGISSATSGWGVRARGARAHVYLEPLGEGAVDRVDAHSRGEMICDANGNLWWCVASGSPGTWRKLAGPATAGTFHAIDPVRAFDSRVTAYANSGLLDPNASKTISVANGHDSTGTVTTTDAVPENATAIAFNVTITDTDGPNFLAVTPGDSAAFSTSTINWTGSGASLANAGIVGIDSSRQVKLWGGDQAGSTHTILDITGYFA